MEQLFTVKDADGNRVTDEIGNPRYFEFKMDAKKLRDALGREEHHVAFGPDHKNYKGY